MQQATVLSPDAAVAWENPARPLPLTLELLQGQIPEPQLAVLFALAGVLRLAFPESDQKGKANHVRFCLAKVLLFGRNPPEDLYDDETDRVEILADLLEKLDHLPGIEVVGLRRDLPSLALTAAEVAAAAPEAAGPSDLGALSAELPVVSTCTACGRPIPREGDCEVCSEHNYVHPARAGSEQVQMGLKYLAQFLPAEAAAPV